MEWAWNFILQNWEMSPHGVWGMVCVLGKHLALEYILTPLCCYINPFVLFVLRQKLNKFTKTHLDIFVFLPPLTSSELLELDDYTTQCTFFYLTFGFSPNNFRYLWDTICYLHVCSKYILIKWGISFSLISFGDIELLFFYFLDFVWFLNYTYFIYPLIHCKHICWSSLLINATTNLEDGGCISGLLISFHWTYTQKSDLRIP